MMRVWAMLTGVVLITWFFAGLALHRPAPDMVSMLATAIAGFEMMLFGQELWFKRGANRG
ncbi:MAG: hypothetical protein KGM17_15890 [Sphingomonadales bacterium]|nr:hypothetical protein [Sphingomonadales bacterium]